MSVTRLPVMRACFQCEHGADTPFGVFCSVFQELVEDHAAEDCVEYVRRSP